LKALKDTNYISRLLYGKWVLNKTITEELELSIKKEKLFWRRVLERILNITLTLAELTFSRLQRKARQ